MTEFDICGKKFFFFFFKKKVYSGALCLSQVHTRKKRDVGRDWRSTNMRRCQKAFIFLSIAVSQGGAAYPSLFLFSFGYDYLFFFYLREKRNKKKGNLLSERCGTTAAAAGQVSIATPCWPTTNCKNPTHKTNKNKRCRDISFHFFFFFFFSFLIIPPR